MKVIITILSVLLFFTSCSKYLEEKPDLKLNTVSSLSDCQALLDRRIYVNERGLGSLEAAADNYYFNMDFWSNLPEEQKNLYTWQPYDNFEDYGFSGNEWSYCYDNVFRANYILDQVDKLPGTQSDRDNIKGQAYFLRANNLLQAAWVWCLAYNKNSARTSLGLPLRVTTNFNADVKRASLEDTYQFILEDLNRAVELLPVKVPHLYRSSKPAALALLARVYLSMNEYDSVFKYTNLCMELKNELLDFNNSDLVDPSADLPFKNFNKEIIYQFEQNPYLTFNGVSFIDTSLVNEYDDNDIRKTAYFVNENGQFRFKGSYMDESNFSGITSAEVLLMRAEAAVRLNKVDIALKDVNELLKYRIESAFYVPLSVNQIDVLLEIILKERRKELVMRGLRFMDVKRLNELGYGISMRRMVDGVYYTLSPRDLRFALPIPDDIVANSSVVQNPR